MRLVYHFILVVVLVLLIAVIMIIADRNCSTGRIIGGGESRELAATIAKSEFPYKIHGNYAPVSELFAEVCAREIRQDHGKYSVTNKFHAESRRLYHEQFRGRYLCLVYDDDDYVYADVITDMYTEKARMMANIDGFPSPLSFWRNPANSAKIAAAAMSSARSGTVTKHDLREAVYSLTKECTQFKSTLAKFIDETLGGTSILDFSAGWGDRLIGAIAARNVVRYRAFDPNTDLMAGHNAIIAELAEHKDRANFTVTYVPFERNDLRPDEMFDIVFTGPPYFNFENYSENVGQSFRNHAGLISWTKDFLFWSLAEAWRHLNVGGHMALYVSDVRGSPVTELMCLYIDAELPGAKFCGVIAQKGAASHSYRPTWVWQKTENVDSARIRQVRGMLKKWYRDYY